MWTPSDKAYLIDSIINEFDIPKIYLADFTWNDSPELNPNKKMYAVIDGKQRFEAMFDFMNNKIALNDDFIYYSNQKFKAAGMKYSDLQKTYPELAEIVEQFNLSVVSVVTEDVEAINELFVRLNRSKALTGAEIRNAMKGDIPKLIRDLSEHEFFTDYISFNKQRGQDKNAAAKLLLFEYYQKPKDTKRSSLDVFAQQENYEKDRLELSYRKTLDQLNILTTVFLPKDKLLRSAGLIPVYYWFIRKIDDEKIRFLRAFITWFEKIRLDSTDNDIIEFIKYNRSTNDEISFTKRIEILEKKFTIWSLLNKS